MGKDSGVNGPHDDENDNMQSRLDLGENLPEKMRRNNTGTTESGHDHASHNDGKLKTPTTTGASATDTSSKSSAQIDNDSPQSASTTRDKATTGGETQSRSDVKIVTATVVSAAVNNNRTKEVSQINEESSEKDSALTKEGGNDKVAVEQSKPTPANTQQTLQTPQPTTKNPSERPSTSSAAQTPLLLKAVSFSNDIRVSGGLDSRLSSSAGGSSDISQQAQTSIIRLSPSQSLLGSQISKAIADLSPMQQAAAPVPSIEDTIHILRAPLVEKYAPFIAPPDSSLKAARERLRTALDQTRRLRAAFTERVYDKYRVILQPVPPSVDAIIDPIKANPAEIRLKLQEEIKSIKEEKDLEKKEAQKFQAAMAASAVDISASGVSTQETAEQLAWFGAGLNIVILPEDSIDDDIDISKYEHRGPTNPETGQRVGGISAAAHAAAEGLLDRVRRGGEMRMERQRRRQLQLLSGEDAEAENDSSSILSHLHLLSSSSTGRVDSSSTSLATPTGKSSKRSSFSSGKGGRSRSQISLSGNTLLSLNPQAEELTSHGGTATAATAALIARGVGGQSNTRSIQQRWRHPHPESQGGRRLALAAQSTGRKPDTTTAAKPELQPMPMSAYIALSLPALPTPKERKEKRPIEVLTPHVASMERERIAVRCVLDQFFPSKETDGPTLGETFQSSGESAANNVDADERKASGTDDTKNSKDLPSPETGTIDSQKKGKGDQTTKRNVTEIGLLRGMQISKERAEAFASENTIATDVENQPVDPILAFSVLHAIGLIQEATKSSGKTIDDKPNAPTLGLLDKIVSRKRPFAETFSYSSDDINIKKFKVDNGISDSAAHESGYEDDWSSNHHSASTLIGNQESKNVGEEMSSKSEGDSSLVASIRGGGQAILGVMDVNISPSQDNLVEEKGPVSRRVAVSSIRGGGRALEDALSSDISKGSNEDPGGPADSSSNPGGEAQLPQPSSNEDDENQRQGSRSSSITGAHEISLTRSSSSPAAYPHGGTSSNGFQLPRQQQSPRARSVSHPLPERDPYHLAQVPRVPLPHPTLHHQPSMIHSELPDYYGAIPPSSQHPGGYVASQHEWSALGAAAAGLLPTQSSLAALGLDSHRAAMVSVSVRERAARVLLAREQAAAAQRHAVAVRGGANLSGLSPQHAVALMGNSMSHRSPVSYHQAAHQSSPFGNLGHNNALPHSHRVAPLAATSPLISGATSPAARSSPGPPPQEQDDRSTVDTPEPSSSIRNPGSLPDEPQANRDNESSASSREATKGLIDRARDSSSSQARDLNVVDGNCLTEEEAEKALGNVHHSVIAAPDPEPTHPSSKDSLPVKSNTKEISVGGDARARAFASVSAGSPEDIDGPTMPLGTSGMRFFVPPRPPTVGEEASEQIIKAQLHWVVENLAEHPESKDKALSSQKAAAMVDYLLAVGAAVPIPKALVSNPLKDRLNTPGFKSPGNGGSSTIPRDVIVAAILVWLWCEHCDSFQRAFARSGRIDVDAECKWLILAAVDAAVRALMLEIADSVARGGPLSVALGSKGAKTTISTGQKPPSAATIDESDSNQRSSTTLDVLVASIVSEALMTELCVDETMDNVLPNFEALVNLLDEGCLSALRSKSCERALVAALISRRANMSEPFSHAYVSAMVRAGEALGHEDLFEIVQEEGTATSTMIPYDIFSDESGAWEDPCRVPDGFTPGLSGEALTRRAHARAMIHKSLKKLQDRHNIRGGTPDAGPYADPPQSTEGGKSSSPGSAVDGRSAYATIHRTNSGLKRKGSFSMVSEPVLPGTGSATATSMSLYRPSHHSTPLIWDYDAMENLPYGRHAMANRKRSFSFGRLVDSAGKPSKKPRPRSSSSSLPSASSSDDGSATPSGLTRSTEGVNWIDVADSFQAVSMPAATTPTSRRASRTHHHAPVVPGMTIVAPFCRKISIPPENEDDDEDFKEEDLSDEAVLARHRVVLDEMKEKLENFMRARQIAQQRAARRSSSQLKDPPTR